MLAVPGTPAQAQGVAAPETVIGAHLYPRPYGLTYVYGRLRVPDGTPAGAVAGQRVDLYLSGSPFTAWTFVTTLTTDWAGYFTYHTTIGQNTSFHAIWQSSAPIQSRDRLVKLPLRVSLRVSRGRGRLLTFRGSSYPPHPGAPIYLQQLDRHGRFRTVTSTTIAAGSTFRRPWRMRKPGGVFRALFPGDGQFGAAASQPVRVARR